MIYQRDNGFSVVGQASLVGGSDDEIVKAWAERHVWRDPDLKWVIGNYIEADRPNSNGHYFPLPDIPAGIETLRGKALNMLHRERYVVGHYVGAQLLDENGVEMSAEDVVERVNNPEGAPIVQGVSRPTVEAVAAFYWNRFPEEYEDIQRAHSMGSLYFCVDPETELMTEDGWRRYGELAEGDVILTMNTETGMSEWLPLEAINTFDYDGEMVRMEGMMHSSLTTPNHRWWVKRKKSRGGVVNEWRTSETLTSLTHIPRAVPHAEFPSEPKWSDALVELVAWFWTEGAIQGGVARIYQSEKVNPGYCDRIRACLTKVYGPPAKVRDGGNWYERDGVPGIRQFIICTEATKVITDLAPDKVPTETFLRSLTEAQANLFFDTSIAADGHIAKADGQVTFTQKDERRTRAFEFLCALLGRPTTTTPIHPSAGEGWRVCVVRRSDYFNPIQRARKGKGFVVDRVPYKGIVWCPTTSNGTFLARRRGTVYWTGNSMEAIPKEVSCLTCDKRVPFAGLSSDTYCSHMNGPVGPKRIHEPRFLGGAIIIPPVKPGWSQAEIKTIARQMMEEDENSIEELYAGFQASSPHLDAETWEALMMQVVMMHGSE